MIGMFLFLGLLSSFVTVLYTALAIPMSEVEKLRQENR